MHDRQKRQRLFTMIFGAFIIFFTGYPHIWSIYQPYVTERTGWSGGEVSFCFYLSLVIFVFGNILGGKLLNRWTPRKVIAVGGGLFSLGVFLSAFMLGKSPVGMYITYGFLQGFGQGMVYSAVVATAQRWFPERIGFASGLVVTANGLCGFFLTPLSRFILERWGVSKAFLFIGLLMAISWILAWIFVAAPPSLGQKEEESLKERGYTTGEMIRTGNFYLLLGAMAFGLMPYFLISPISQTVLVEKGILPGMAAAAVTLGAAANAGLRLFLPALSDKVGRAVCIRWVIILSGILMAVLLLFSSYGAVAAVILLYGYYGGIMGTFPSYTSSLFGLRHAGENYAYVLLGMVAASCTAPVAAQKAALAEQGRWPLFAMGIVFAVMAYVCMMILKRRTR